MRLVTLGGILSIVITLVGCGADKAEELPEPDSSDTISFSEDVFPIFTSICADPACHSPSGVIFNLTNHSEISNRAESILFAVKREGSATPMPWIPGTSDLAPMLEEERIQLIERWINADKPDN